VHLAHLAKEFPGEFLVPIVVSLSFSSTDSVSAKMDSTDLIESNLQRAQKKKKSEKGDPFDQGNKCRGR
jgi:hypothetical protein